jgi:serine protease inhibitor
MKKVINILLVVALLATMLCACTRDENIQPIKKEPKDNGEVVSPVMNKIANVAPKKSKAIKDAMLDFNLKLLKELNENEKNLFYSAMSINSALTMTYFGANGDTKDEMHNALSYGDMTLEDIASAQKALIKSYEKSGDTTFNTANSIWIDDGYPIKQSFIDTMSDVFKTETQNVPMADPKTVDKVNGWVSDKTEGMIEKLFEKANNPLASVKMILMNAIYFNGEWTTPFDPDRTYKRDFSGATEITQVDMMSTDEDVLGYVGDDYKAISLPYGDDERFSMVVVLPNDDINAFVESQTKDSLKKVLTTFEEQSNAIVQLPKFEMEETLRLNDALNALGIKKAFMGDADFSNMADSLFIDTVLHKAKVEVDEKGTEAAAVTAVTMCESAAPEFGFEFFADKPFLFFIVDGEEDMVLFTGKVANLE